VELSVERAAATAGGRRVLEPAPSNPWRCVRRSYAYEGRGFRVRRDAVIRPDGTSGDYEFAEVASSFSVVVAVDEDRQVYLVRQWRYPWEQSSWEAPAGHLEAEEGPLEAAKRELAEEAGLVATSWQQLATLRNSASITAQSYLFLARALRPVATRREASEGDMVIRRLPLDDALTAVAAGEIVHAVTISALFLAERALADPS